MIKMANKNICLVLFLVFGLTINAQVKAVQNGTDWELLVNNKPFKIKGATFGYVKDIANYDRYFKELQFLGVNSIRLWATDDNTGQLLDVAERHDIKVMVGIWMRHGRPGMEDDDSFNYLKDKEGIEDQYENAINVVNQFKDHPAVLTWTIGNEVYLNTATDEEKIAYSKVLERICAEIKTIDKNHPIVSVEAWTFGLKWWEEYVPSLDIYGLNCYGYGANLLEDELEKQDINKPYIVTEFGVTGEWDIEALDKGLKVEPSDQEKFKAIAEGYPNWIANKSSNLGVYVFHYADEVNHMAPWLLTHFNGFKRPQYWAIRKAFTGEDPLNYIPEITKYSLPEKTYNSGDWIPVNLEVKDKEKESLRIQFYSNQRTGSRKRRDQLVSLTHRGDFDNGFEILAPKEYGVIKVYATVNDTYGNVGIASKAIEVSDEDAKNKKFLVPKKSLPFYVYREGEEMPYLPSAYMGNYKAMTVETQSTEEVYAGNAALKIDYTASDNWYGLGLVDPANDWGEILGGYELSGATKFSFWAKASKNDVYATIGFGLIGKDKPFPDTAKISKEIKLSTKWKKYTLKIKKADMSCIRSGLVLFSQAYNWPQTIYIDEVVFE